MKDDDYRVKPAVIQAFCAGSEVTVPKKTAEVLIARGSAQAFSVENKD
ncbi:hypothetical protein [Loktanella salsilacus]